MKLAEFLEFQKHLLQESRPVFHRQFLFPLNGICLCSPGELSPLLCVLNPDSDTAFDSPSVLRLPDLPFVFHLISRLEEVYHIIRQWSRTKQYIKSQHSILFCREKEASSFIMRLEKEDSIPGTIFQELKGVDMFN